MTFVKHRKSTVNVDNVDRFQKSLGKNRDRRFRPAFLNLYTLFLSII